MCLHLRKAPAAKGKYDLYIFHIATKCPGKRTDHFGLSHQVASGPLTVRVKTCWNWSLDFLQYNLCICFSSKSSSWLTWQNFNPVIPRLLVAAVLVHWIKVLIAAICASFLVPFWDTDSKHKGWSVSNALSIINGMGNTEVQSRPWTTSSPLCKKKKKKLKKEA